MPLVAGDAKLVRGARKPSPTSLKGLSQRLLGWRIDPPDNEVRPAGDGLRVGGFSVVESPGHTPRHVSFLHEDRSVVIFGDVVRTTEDGFALPPWYLNGDSGQVRASVAWLDERLPPFEVAIVGHGPPIGEDASQEFHVFTSLLDA